MTALDHVQTDTGAQESRSEITIVTTIAKTGNRYVLGIPAKFEECIKRFHGMPCRVKLEPLL